MELLRKAAPELFEPRFKLSPELIDKLRRAARFYWPLSSQRVQPYAPRCDQAARDRPRRCLRVLGTVSAIVIPRPLDTAGRNK